MKRNNFIFDIGSVFGVVMSCFKIQIYYAKKCSLLFLLSGEKKLYYVN